MRAAPPVGLTCSDALAWRVARMLLAGSAAAVFLAWTGLHLQWPAGPALALLGGLTAGGLDWRLRRAAACALRWDGQRWTVDGLPADVHVMLDPGPWLLLRARLDAGAARWLPLSRAQVGPAWAPLRAALHARTAGLPPAGSWHE